MPELAGVLLPIAAAPGESSVEAVLRLNELRGRLVFLLGWGEVTVFGRSLLVAGADAAERLRAACNAVGLDVPVTWLPLESEVDRGLAGYTVAAAARALWAEPAEVARADAVLAREFDTARLVKAYSVPPPMSAPAATGPVFDPAALSVSRLVVTDVHRFNNGVTVPVGTGAVRLTPGLREIGELVGTGAGIERLYRARLAQNADFLDYLAEAAELVGALGGICYDWRGGDGLLCTLPERDAVSALAWAMQRTDRGYLSSVASVRLADVPRKSLFAALDLAQQLLKNCAGGPLEWGVHYEYPDPVSPARAGYADARVAAEPNLKNLSGPLWQRVSPRLDAKPEEYSGKTPSMSPDLVV
ncbi:hypothetical protein [Amycolatopsis sp.]|uniref:hypothetical protein n=1 Tax=Amycolatopsis sp. TaxID=37632 RepID=UPI002CCF2036|nr:hypothetical protein [Amycolatopsis sp.]HVV08476.1 hypothetical protein [Amycolatopsis sp.]